MSRHVRSRSKRVATASTIRDNPTPLTVTQPIHEIVSSSEARAAASLAQFAGVSTNLVGDILSRRAHRASLAGTAAAIEGRQATAEEVESDAFMIAYEAPGHEKTLIELEARAELLFQNFDFTTGTRESLQSELETMGAQTFSALDVDNDVDAHFLPMISGGLADINDLILGKYDAEILQQMADQTESSFFAIARKDFETNDTIDTQSLRDAMYPILGGTGTNDLLASILTDVAVRNGRPDLLDAMPDEFINADGSTSPSPKFINKYDDAMRNARLSAEAQRVYNERLEETADEDALEELHKQTEIDRFVTILEGDQDVTNQLRQDVAAGDLSPERGRTMVTFQRSFQNAAASGAIMDEDSWSAYASLEIKILTRDLTLIQAQAAIRRAMDDGQLGSGRQLATNVSALMGQARTIESATRNSIEYTSAVAMLKADYPVQRDELYGREMPESAQYTAQVLRKFAVLVSGVGDVGGMSPTDAAVKVRAEFSEDRVFTSTATTLLDRASAAVRYPDITANLTGFLADALRQDVDPLSFLRGQEQSGTLSERDVRQLITLITAREQEGL